MKSEQPRSRNFAKHTSRNPAQRWLLGRFHAALLELIETSVGGRAASALEVGCGEGFVLDILRRRLPQVSPVGLDVDAGALALALGRLEGAPLYLADACHLPFSDDAFDLVLCLEVLEHLEEPSQALAELARVSRGDVIVSVPNQPFFSLANLLRGKNIRSFGDDPEHRRCWGAASFLAFLEQELEIKRVLYPFPWILAVGVGAQSPTPKPRPLGPEAGLTGRTGPTGPTADLRVWQAAARGRSGVDPAPGPWPPSP